MADRGRQSALSTLWWKTQTKETYVKLPAHVDVATGTRVLHDHELLLRLFYGPTVIERDHSTSQYLVKPQTEEMKVSYRDDPLGVTEEGSMGLGFHVSSTWQVVSRDTVPPKQDGRNGGGSGHGGASGDSKTALLDLEGWCLREVATFRSARVVSSMLNLHHSNDVSMKLRVLAKAMDVVGTDPTVATVDLVTQTKQYVVDTYSSLYTRCYDR